MSQPSAAERARILIVDDEPGIREFVDRALREAGYVTATAADGPDALQVAEGSGAFELLLTDVRMPAMNGDDLARRIRQREHGRQEYRAEHVEMWDRIQREPTLEARRRVSELVGRDTMHDFVNDSGHHDDRDDENCVNDLHMASRNASISRLYGESLRPH